MEISKRFTFEAAHNLPNVPPGHKCSRLHGHSYAVTVCVTGPVHDQSGWVMDFSDIATAWQHLFVILDHHHLNEIEGLENPTSEVLSIWIWARLAPLLRGLSTVCVSETCTSGVVYRGPLEP